MILSGEVFQGLDQAPAPAPASALLFPSSLLGKLIAEVKKHGKHHSD